MAICFRHDVADAYLGIFNNKFGVSCVSEKFFYKTTEGNSFNLFGAHQMPDYLFPHSKAFSLSPSQIIFTSIGSCVTNWFAQ